MNFQVRNPRLSNVFSVGNFTTERMVSMVTLILLELSDKSASVKGTSSFHSPVYFASQDLSLNLTPLHTMSTVSPGLRMAQRVFRISQTSLAKPSA